MVENLKNRASFFGIRHLQCLLIFLGLSVTLMQRVNLSVAIVAMMDRNSTNPDFEEFQWSEKTKSYLLSAFFWGYFVTQIPGSQLAHRYGGKITMLGSISLSAVLTLLIPISARIGDWKLLCALRMTQGLIQGCIFPSIHTLLSKWVPVEERGTLGTFCYTGLSFGTVAMMIVSGWIAASPLGWPGIFYFSGAVSLLWALIWYVFGASSPSDCKWISEEEKLMVESALGSSVKAQNGQAPTKTPWLKILTSVPFWVLLIAQSSYAWCFYTLLTQIPSYMKSVLGQDIKSNALMSALPYLAHMCLTFVFCSLSNFLMNRGYTTVYASRKLFNTIGFWVPVAPLILLGYMRAEQSQLALGMLVIAVGASAAGSLGFLTNHIDLSPNFGGILMGIGGFAATVMSLLAPLTVGLIVTDAKDVSQWRVIFYIAASFYFIGNLLFLLFGKTEIQPWNYPWEKIDPRDHIKFETNVMKKEEYENLN